MKNLDFKKVFESAIFFVIPFCFVLGVGFGVYTGISMNTSSSFEHFINVLGFGFVGGIAGTMLGVGILKLFVKDDDPPACPK